MPWGGIQKDHILYMQSIFNHMENLILGIRILTLTIKKIMIAVD